MAFCMMCGQESDPGRKFCIHCGASVESPTDAGQAQSQPPTPGDVIPPPPGGAASRARWLIVAAVAAALVGCGGIVWWTTSQGRSASNSGVVAPVSESVGLPDVSATATASEAQEMATSALPSKAASSTQAAPTPTVTITETAVAFADGVVPNRQVVATAMTPCPNNLAGVTVGNGPDTLVGTGAEMLVDGDLATGWRCDDRRDYREGNVNTVSTTGQVVAFNFETPVALTALEVVEGAAKDSFRWCENGRLQLVQWDFRDGSPSVLTEFPDRSDFPAPSELYFEIPLEPARTTTSVTMTVLSIYPASLDCRLNGEPARPWEYGATARPSEVRFVGAPS